MKQPIKSKYFLQAASVLSSIILLVITTIPISATTSQSEIITAESSIGSLSDILLEESFEDGIMPPPQWSLETTNPDHTWEVINDPENAYQGDYFARVTRSNPPEQDEWLKSPDIDLTNAEEIILEFWAKTIAFGSDWTVELHIIGDGFDDILWDCVEEEEWLDEEWHNKTFNLDQYSGETITIAWRYVGTRGYQFDLDYIQVAAGEIPPAAELELEIKRFGFLKISAVIENIANDPEAIAEDIQWTMNATGNGLFKKLNFSAEGTIPELQPEDTATIELPVFGLSLIEGMITVTTDDPRVEEINESFRALVLLIFVLVLG
jgi:hypothetical protein